MNLLLLAHRVPYPANKGEKIRTFNHLDYLVSQGHNVTVVAPLENDEERKFADQLSKLLNIKVIHEQLGSRYLRMLNGLISGQSLSVTNFHSANLQSKITKLIETEKPDAVMCTSSAMARYVFHAPTAALLEKQKVRLVMDFMDLDSLKWDQYATRKPWPLSVVYRREAKLLSEFETQALHRFDASLFVSAEEKDLLQNDPLLKSKVHVVTNGVDAKAYYPATTATRDDQRLFDYASPVLLFTGVMDYFPNEDAVVWFADTIWPTIHKQYPLGKFIIAGMRPSRKVKDLADRPSIEVTGFLEEILPYYQQADFLVAPFRVARGVQNKVLQALACGLPVITSAQGAAGIKCVPNEHLLVAETAAEYLAAIKSLLQDQERYNSFLPSAPDESTGVFSPA